MKRITAVLGSGVVVGGIWGLGGHYLLTENLTDTWASGFLVGGIALALFLGFFCHFLMDASLSAFTFGLVTSLVVLIPATEGEIGRVLVCSIIPALVCALLGMGGNGIARILKKRFVTL